MSQECSQQTWTDSRDPGYLDAFRGTAAMTLASTRPDNEATTPMLGSLAADAARLNAVHTSRHAAFVCDPSLRVYASNLAAVTLLNDGVSIEGGRVVIKDCLSRQRFLKLLQTDASDNACRESFCEAMLVTRVSRKTPLQLVLKPVTEDTAPGYGRARPLWRVEVSDPAAIPPAAICAIAKMYALTPAEVRLAHQLMLGATVQEAADGISVAVATIRSQLSTILRKTGARRQAELIRLLSVVPV